MQTSSPNNQHHQPGLFKKIAVTTLIAGAGIAPFTPGGCNLLTQGLHRTQKLTSPRLASLLSTVKKSKLNSQQKEFLESLIRDHGATIILNEETAHDLRTFIYKIEKANALLEELTKRNPDMAAEIKTNLFTVSPQTQNPQAKYYWQQNFLLLENLLLMDDIKDEKLITITLEELAENLKSKNYTKTKEIILLIRYLERLKIKFNDSEFSFTADELKQIFAKKNSLTAALNTLSSKRTFMNFIEENSDLAKTFTKIEASDEQNQDLLQAVLRYLNQKTSRLSNLE